MPKSTLYKASKEQISALMFLKRQKRLEKGGSDFNCIVVEHYAPEDYECSLLFFLRSLKKNIHQFQDKTRFQLAVSLPYLGHWYLIDCYIRNGQLYTFSLDAAGFANKEENAVNLLKTHFPSGKHYCFIPDEGRIQYSASDCQTFTREQAGIVSNIDPDTLYMTLAKNADQHSRTINLDQMAKVPMLTKLVRGIQSLTKYQTFPETVKQTVVSSKGTTLNKWIESNSTLGEDNKIQNTSISKKDKKYADELNVLMSSPSGYKHANNYAGFGFITFPAISRILPGMQELSLSAIQKIIAQAIAALQQAPKYTDTLSFLHIPAVNSVIVRQTIDELRQLNQLCEEKHSSAKYITQQFGDMMSDLSGRLVYKHSVRTINKVNELFNQLETDFAATSLQSRTNKK